jgi:Kdo2-lipid IVA lauroyltransferase/acyltransferase
LLFHGLRVRDTMSPPTLLVGIPAKPDQTMRSTLNYLAYLLARILVCTVQALPIETCAAGARGLATLCCDVLRFRYAVIDDNLRHAFPELSPADRHKINWQMWEHLFLMAVEVLHAPRKIHDTNWRDYTTPKNHDALMRAFFDDRPTVIICGHYGNFELSGYVLGLLGFPSFTIARPLDNPFLDRFLNEFREATGQYILPKVGSAPQVENVLARGGILVLLGDQHAGNKGCWVDFFGRPASSHKAIALFALGKDTLTAYCHTRRTGKPLHLELNMLELLNSREIPAEMRTVPGITRWYNQHLEATIREAPEQYWWVHRRWKDDRAKRKTAAQQARPAMTPISG